MKFSNTRSNVNTNARTQVHESVCSCFSCVFSNLKVLYMERGARLLSRRRNSIRRNDRHPPHLVVRVVKVTDRAQNLFRVWTFHHLTRTRWTRFEDVKRFVVRSSNKDAKEETAVPPAPTTQQRDSARDTMMGFSSSPPPPPSPALRDVVEMKEKNDVRIWKRVSEFLSTQHSSKSRRIITLRPLVSGFRPVTPPLSTRHHRRNQYRT